MVDTLAPKKVFSQRDLDKSLIQPTPVGRSIMAPASNVLDAAPEVATQKSLTDTPQPDYVIDKNQWCCDRICRCKGRRIKSGAEQSAIKLGENNGRHTSTKKSIHTERVR